MTHYSKARQMIEMTWRVQGVRWSRAGYRVTFVIKSVK